MSPCIETITSAKGKGQKEVVEDAAWAGATGVVSCRAKPPDIGSLLDVVVDNFGIAVGSGLPDFLAQRFHLQHAPANSPKSRPIENPKPKFLKITHGTFEGMASSIRLPSPQH